MRNPLLLTILCLTSLLTSCGSEPPSTAVEDAPSFDDIVAKSQSHDGLLDFFRDKESGELYLSLGPDELNREYIYAAKFLDGHADSWTSRGVHAPDRIIRFHRQFKKLEILSVNFNHYFDPNSALARSAEANRVPGLMAVAEIVAEHDDGRILAKVDPVFLSEALTPIKAAADPEAKPGEAFTLGEFNAEKSSVRALRAYPKNSGVIVDYIFEDPAPLVEPGRSFADARIVTIVVQHSFLAMPDEGFEPRFADPRVGYFAHEITDMTSFSATPWRDPIQRWRLIKKDPGAELSEPVEPIVFWLENTTPLEFRDEVTAGILAWNAAFEQAGFKNAIQAKQQPDDAQWDAEDLRYNVVRWTSSEESPWGGYGPAFSNPRTGEIMGSDIMLDFRWLTSYNSWDRLFVEPSSNFPRGRGGQLCELGAERAAQLSLAALTMEGGSREYPVLLNQSVTSLVMHEVGHTLGLNHNFIASMYHSPEQLNDKQLTTQHGVASSVMDYIPPNLAPPGKAQGAYFSTAVGIYDRWAIEFGYSQATSSAQEEAERLAAILARSTDPALAFGMDNEAMNDSGSGLDPRILRFDESSDPIAAGNGRVALIQASAAKARERLAQQGASWQSMYNAYQRLSGEIGRQGMVASRWIGGVFTDKAMQGQAGAGLPLQSVPLVKQQQAMALIREKVFAPNAFSFTEDFYHYLQQTRRGSNFAEQPQAAQPHARTLQMQKQALDHLLHPDVMHRILDSQLYGNEYDLVTMTGDLTDAVFAADLASPVNTQRQQLQGEYVTQLIAITAGDRATGHSQPARSAALAQLLRIQSDLQKRNQPDSATSAHTASLLLDIQRSLDD
jgi:hypothetical protein